jgi:hypothetical protein
MKDVTHPHTPPASWAPLFVALWGLGSAWTLGALLVQLNWHGWAHSFDGPIYVRSLWGFANGHTWNPVVDLQSLSIHSNVLLVLLVGHGSGEGAGSKVNLPGPDATASEYAAWLAPFGAQQVVFVNAATGSGDFVPVIAGSGRVVMTATRSAVEKNEAEFLQHFARALTTDDADANKDGRLSALEAFRFARAEVAKSYEANNRMLTEHAVLSDSAAAARVSFGARAATSDPRVARLLEERQALESQVAALRARKATMEPAAYEAELERLLLALAEKSAAIKAAGGSK